MGEATLYLRFLATLTAVLDPFLAVPIFVAVCAGRTAAARTALIRAVVATVFFVLAGAAIVGEELLLAIGASMPAFRVAGGLVLLLMALAMLSGQAGGVRQTRDEAAEVESGDMQGVVPLAVPLLAGPGAISTTIIVAQAGSGWLHLAAVIGCITLVCVLTWIVLRLADPIGARLGQTGLNVATRLLGLLLAALAIQTMAEGLKGLFPALV